MLSNLHIYNHCMRAIWSTWCAARTHIRSSHFRVYVWKNAFARACHSIINMFRMQKAKSPGARNHPLYCYVVSVYFSLKVHLWFLYDEHFKSNIIYSLQMRWLMLHMRCLNSIFPSDIFFNSNNNSKQI